MKASGGVESAELQNGRRVRGRWSVRYLSCIGRADRANVEAFPVTVQILTAIPGATTSGMTFFSAIDGGTRIMPHCGFTNAHLRCHLTLQADGASSRIRVGDDSRVSRPGEALVFDDTFEHEAWNDSDDTRYVLVFDFPHPDLEALEVEATQFVMDNFRRHFIRSYWRTVMMGDKPEGASLETM